jgi:hypothetical protein
MIKKFTITMLLFFVVSANAYYGPERLSHLIRDGDFTCTPNYLKGRMDGQLIQESVPYSEGNTAKARLTIANNRSTAYFEGMGPLYFDAARSYRSNYTEHGWYAHQNGTTLGIINIMPWGANGLYITMYAHKDSKNWLRVRLKCKRGRFY